jgi:hypothetical protein
MNRISQGFHRIAIVVTVPLFLAGLILSVLAYQDWSADVASDKIHASEALATEKAQRNGEISLPDWWKVAPVVVTKRFEQYAAAPLIWFFIALMAYIGIRSIGWIIHGFMRDPDGN